MTGKFTLKLEGDAYADGLATADKFLTLITDRLDKIDRVTDNILDLTNLNADALEDIRAAIKDLEEAKAALSDD
jgi:ABC-type transporter Mla subunit MlaD